MGHIFDLGTLTDETKIGAAILEDIVIKDTEANRSMLDLTIIFQPTCIITAAKIAAKTQNSTSQFIHAG